VPSIAARIAGQMLCIFAAVTLGFVAQMAGLSGLQHARAQHVEYAELRQSLARATISVNGLDPKGRLLVPGTPIALIEIPKIGVKEVVGEGTSGGSLTSGPGHRRDTVFPGQVGVSVIMGRRAAYGGPFSSLRELQAGDQIKVTTGQGIATFSVTDVRYSGDPQPEPPDPGIGRLTLVTADGPPYFPTDAIRVDADTVTPAFQTVPPPVNAQGLTDAEQAMAGDKTALMPLVLLSQLLLLSTALIVWVRYRVGRWHAWVIGVPVLTSLGLTVADEIARLMPNLL